MNEGLGFNIEMPDLVSDTIESFKTKVRAWWGDVLKVSNDKTNYPPEIAVQRTKLLASAKRIKAMIEKLGGDFSDEQQLDAIFVPVIAGVAAAGVLGFISKWYFDYKKYTARIDAYKAGIAQGLAPVEAARGARIAGEEPMSGTMKLILLIGVGGMGYLYAREKGYI